MTKNQETFPLQPVETGAALAFLRRLTLGARMLFRTLASALLLLFQPVIEFVLCALALTLTILSVILKLSGAVPNFPFWGMLGLAAGFYLLFALYTGFVLLISPKPE